MKRLLVANLVVACILLVAVGLLGYNQWRLDQKRDAQYDSITEQNWALTRIFYPSRR